MEQPILLVQGQENWLEIESLAQNAVVQIFAQIGRFNWLEPYTIDAQFENRGSGFFINDQGYLVTNAHVVDEAKRVWITIPALGGETIHVEIVGFCPDRDLALLRVRPDDLRRIKKQVGRIPFLLLGDSDVVQRTDRVLVLGYPLGQHNMKSTTGVISGREAVTSVSYLEITAPINEGSSGGPLISADGSVIGITVAMIANASNVGYAIPVNELKTVLEDLLKKPLLGKPILGAFFQNTTDDHAKFLGNPVPGGLYIHKIVKGSLLEKAGILPGDMIYEFNDYRLDSRGEAIVNWSAGRATLYDLISRLELGKKIKLILYRNGKKKQIDFTLKQSPPYPVRIKYPDYEKVEYEIIGGMVIMELAQNHLPLLINTVPFLIKYQEIENMLNPVLVISHILPGSFAHQLRCLVPGDIIKKANGGIVNTIEQFRKILLNNGHAKYLSIKTENDVLAVFPFQKILEDEKRLSTDFVYPLSATVQKILNMVKNGRKKTT